MQRDSHPFTIGARNASVLPRLQFNKFNLWRFSYFSFIIYKI